MILDFEGLCAEKEGMKEGSESCRHRLFDEERNGGNGNGRVLFGV